MMKRFVKLLVLTVALAALLAVSAFAADFTHCADALHELGLFQGTDAGYDLDRAPTRAEAAAMLVRLLGAEEEAQAIEAYTAPFTDVREWAQPYVQYLYDNGLSNGMDDTTFGASRPCTAQQYATFLLRALGYSDAEGGDFTYATALDFARELGVVDDLNCDPQNFLRDDVAAMSFTALATAPKTGEADLLTKLVDDGAIDDAKGYDEMFEAYRAYVAASASSADETNVSMHLDMSMDVAIANAPLMSAEVGTDVAMIANPEQMDETQMAYTMDMTMTIDPDMAESAGMTAEDATTQVTVNCYYTDGALYMDSMGQKVRMPLSFEEYMGQMPAAAESSREPLSAFSDITRTTRGGITYYEVTYATAPFNSLIGTVLSMMPTEEMGMSGELTIGELTMTMGFRGDSLETMEMTMAMTMEAEGQTVTVNMTADISDIVLGDAVTVTLPDDLDTYVDVSDIAAASPEQEAASV